MYSLVLPYWPEATRASMYSRMASGKAKLMVVLLMGVIFAIVITVVNKPTGLNKKLPGRPFLKKKWAA